MSNILGSHFNDNGCKLNNINPKCPHSKFKQNRSGMAIFCNYGAYNQKGVEA
jgi:hypothetical protein